MAWTFKKLHEKLRTARNVHLGKPLENETRAMLRGGTIEEPMSIAVQHYSTDILTFWPDGSIDIDTSWTSNTTRERFYTYGGKSIYSRKLPSFNGRRPGQESAMCIHCSSGKVYVFRGLNNKIRFDPNGVIDPNSVAGIFIETVTDPKLASATKRKFRQIRDQILVRSKLGAQGRYVSDHFAWLKDNLDKRIEDIDYMYAPRDLRIPGKPIEYARMIGAIKRVEIKQLNA